MDELTHNEDLLIQYLDGELSAEEKTILEERLRTDRAMQDQLTKLRAGIQAVKQFGTIQQVAAIHSEMTKELRHREKGKVIGISKAVRYAIAVAASIFVLFIGGRLYMAAQLSSEKLYNEAYVDFNASSTRYPGNSISEIEKHYQQQDYEAVITGTRSGHLDAEDSLLIGLSYLHTERTSQAIGFFQRITSSDNDYRQDGEFYLSLGYLKNRDYDKALSLIEKIAADTAHLYHKQFPIDFIEKVKRLKDK